MKNVRKLASTIFYARNHLSLRRREHEKNSASPKVRKISGEVIFGIFAIVFSSWLMFHTFSYNSSTHEMRIAFKLWSDFAAHIPLIRSFSMGPNFDRLIHLQTIEYPIYPGEPIRYHFLFDMFVGLLEKAGLRIDWALNIPSIIGFTLLLISIYLLAQKLFHSKTVAILSVLFFLFNGSLAFIHFFELHPLSLKSINDIVQAKDFPAFAPWGPGDITAFWNLNIYTNQRHLAGAFAIILFFILTCLHIEHRPFNKQLSWATVWAILIGILPFYHQPALLIMATIMLTYFAVFPCLRKFLFVTGIWSLVLVVPQLLLTHGSGSAVEWYPGYIIHNELQQLEYIEKIGRMIIFWWNNLGLHSVLILIGFILIPKRARKIVLPLIPIFLIGNLFKFSVEVGANHKFFNFVMILGAMISAYIIVYIFQNIWKLKRVFLGLLVSCLLFLVTLSLTLSGVIDFFVVKNDTIGSAKDIGADEAATWIAQNTPKNAVFLNSTYMYHPASVAGRSVYLGWPYFAWSAGYRENRMLVMDTLYETRDSAQRCALLKKRNITYITVENVLSDRDLPKIEAAYFVSHYKPIFQNQAKTYFIFATEALCAPSK